MMYNILIVTLLLANAGAFAQDIKIPETNAGKKLTVLLETLEFSDSDRFFAEHVSEKSFEQTPLTEQKRFFGMVNRMHGGFNFHSVIVSKENRIEALAKSKSRADAYRKITIETEHQPPHKILFWQIDFADPPDANTDMDKPMTENEILKWADTELQKMWAEDRFSGAFLIARNATPIFTKAYGLASKEFKVKNQIDTKFNIGSINKAFTQVALAQLLHRGQINVDDPMGKYVDGFPEEVATKVTIRHLLTMTSGMGHYWNEEYYAKYPRIKTVGDLIDIIRKIPLDFEPGTDQQYSNSGYTVLGAIIEAVTGTNYYEYIRKNVYDPAGMQNTDSYDLEQIVPNVATGYFPNESSEPFMGNKFQNNIYQRAVRGGPAGGGYSTVEDLNKFVEALKQNKLVNEKYTNMVLDFFENLDNPDRRPQGYFMGGGAPYGVNGTIEADFQSGYTVIALSNYPPPAAMAIAQRVLKLLLNQK